MIIERDWFSIIGLIWVNDRKPGAVCEVNWDRSHCGQEKVVLSQNLFVGLKTKKVCGAFWDEYAITLLIVGSRCQSRKEFAQELGVLWHTFDAKDLGRHLRWFLAVAKAGAVDFECREDRHKLIAARHCVKSSLFQVWRKVNSKVSLNFNHH